MKKPVTYKKIIAFSKIGALFVNNNKGDETKLIESIKVVLRGIRRDGVLDVCDELLNENSLALCSVDENGNIKRDGNNLLFTPKNQLELNKRNKDVFNKTVEINVCILDENENDVKKLSLIELECFEGIVIKEPAQ